MGLQARLMSQALRKLTGTVSKSRATVMTRSSTDQALKEIFLTLINDLRRAIDG